MIANERAQDEALQACLEQMSQLLIDEDLQNAQPGDSLSMVARARTLATLTRLGGGNRKGSLVRFLYESGLITMKDIKDGPVLNLDGGDVSGVVLHDVNLQNACLGKSNMSAANLKFVNLGEADLSRVDLSRATLVGTNLSGTDLSEANLSGANIISGDLGSDRRTYYRRTSSGGEIDVQMRVRIVHQGGQVIPVRVTANLSNARLRGANLNFAKLPKADLTGSDLRNVTAFGAHLNDARLTHALLMRSDLRGIDLRRAALRSASFAEADLRNADLRGAQLQDADLSGAWLDNANLSEAILEGANLRRATLEEANLNRVEGVTKDQLEQPETLKGATMPNGQTYEDWLKSQDHAENG